MNKPPQPLTGPPPSAPPHPPAPSPGLSQPGFPSQQPSVVFATPPPMNPAQQPPRQPYYQPQRPSLASSGGRVQPPSSAPRPIPGPHGTHPAHVYQPGSHSQVMMIPQQPIPFANSQTPAYFIPGQYRAPYVTPQQYQVTGSPGFYPGTSPGDYAGAYYPAQPQFTPPVQPINSAPGLISSAPVLISPAPQQQAPPQQQQQAQQQHKRERKQLSKRYKG
ncbi:eukaryotic translation initiation factor 4 gamma 1-like [Sardina pilchardus]|uniref:eukaryotic translation initiation factor 4 gamma 1-like n=1 Tax=Sardina pilchardus TaxID=27697 RepID=UPI002E164E4C